MAHAVFLRAANVGGHNVFRPKAFCEDHPELRLTNFGAAGTFSSGADAPAAEVEAALRAALPIDAGVVAVPADDMRALVARDPFSDAPEGTKAEVTVLLRPRPRPGLAWPEGEQDIHLDGDLGWCVLTCRRPGGRGRSPQAVVERAAGAPATTRSWGVVRKVAAAL